MRKGRKRRRLVQVDSLEKCRQQVHISISVHLVNYLIILVINESHLSIAELANEINGVFHITFLKYTYSGSWSYVLGTE